MQKEKKNDNKFNANYTQQNGRENSLFVGLWSICIISHNSARRLKAAWHWVIVNSIRLARSASNTLSVSRFVWFIVVLHQCDRMQFSFRSGYFCLSSIGRYETIMGLFCIAGSIGAFQTVLCPPGMNNPTINCEQIIIVLMRKCTVAPSREHTIYLIHRIETNRCGDLERPISKVLSLLVSRSKTRRITCRYIATDFRSVLVDFQMKLYARRSCFSCISRFRNDKIASF